MASSAAMREPTYFVLTTLLDGPLHGHGIIKQAEQLSDGRVHLAAGTLYAALDRLTREGLIEAVRQETVNGRVRQYYALTGSGASALHAEADRMAQAARLVTARRAGRSVSPSTRPTVAFS